MEMISKPNFIKIIQALKAQYQQEMAFTEAIKPFFDGHPVCTLTSQSVEKIIKALEAEFKVDDLISWWMFECDFGKTAKAQINGDELIISTPDKLYEFLIDI